MNLFNFFNKKENNNSKKAHSKKYIPLIDIIPINYGSHSDNYAGLIGYDFQKKDEGKLLTKYIKLSLYKNPVFIKNETKIYQTMLQTDEITNKRLGIRTIKHAKNILSAYPYLQTNYTVPFRTKQIFEWSHNKNLEAEIKGTGRNTFGFCFFATDYAVNKNIYKSREKIDVKVSAICLTLHKSNLTEIYGQKLNKEFTSYLPNEHLSNPSYYDFIGILVDFNQVNLTKNNTGYIIKVKLINENSNPDFFTVDMFINKENMRIKRLEKEMKIMGVLWFQGEIG